MNILYIMLCSTNIDIDIKIYCVSINHFNIVRPCGQLNELKIHIEIHIEENRYWCFRCIYSELGLLSVSFKVFMRQKGSHKIYIAQQNKWSILQKYVWLLFCKSRSVPKYLKCEPWKCQMAQIWTLIKIHSGFLANVFR